MKILFSTDQIYLHGGIEKVMAGKANYFADILGFDVCILTTQQKGKAPCYPISSKIQLVDLAVDYVREKSYFHPVNITKIPRHFFRWKSAMKKIAPDVIISCNFAFDFYWLPFCYKSAAKFKEYHSSRYFHEQARQNSGFFANFRYSADDYIESKFDRLIVLNPDEKAFFRSNNIAVIPNSISLPPETSPLSANRAIAAGRIAPVKGFDMLIRAWKHVAENHPEWELHIFGQGEESYIDGLSRLISGLDLSKQVFIRGATSSLKDEMIDSSLYVMTSRTECYPMVLLEAASVGLPIITFDCPTGPRHIVANGQTGMLVRDQDADAFAKEIVLLIRNRQKIHELGRNAKNNSGNFSNETVMQQWVSLFNTLNG